MAYGSSRIKGITVEIGGDTTKLDKALGGINHELSTVQANLGSVSRKLKLDPGAADLLTQKLHLLGEQSSLSKEKAAVLEDALKQLDQQFASGEIDAEKYAKAVGNIKTELAVTNSEIRTAAKDISSIGDELKKTGRLTDDAAEIVENLGSTADDAGNRMGGLGDFAKGASDALGLSNIAAAGAAFTLGQTLVNAAINAAKEIWNLDEATEEYRVAMGKLNTAFETAGYGAEAAAETYRGFYAILGDTDTATEASQLLAKLADDEEDLAKWVDIAAGVYGTFGDALPINSLIEAANETKEVGKVTGVLADALNWAGISEDDFNATLEKIPDSADRANLIMDTLTRTYENATDAFYANNEALIASRDAQADMDESMATLGEAVSNVKTELSEAFGPTLTVLINIAAEAINALVAPIQAIGDMLDWLGDRVRDVANFFRDLFGVSGRLDENWNVVQNQGASNAEQWTPKSYRAISTPYSLAAITAQDLPHLANGAVTRPNKPFLAVVGDNPTEQEIIAPLSTIRQAVGEAMSANGGFGGNVRVTVTFNGDLAPLIRQLQPMIVAETDRRGPQAVT